MNRSFIRLLLAVALLLEGFSGVALAAREQEQLALETQLQNRIEGILAKTLPPNSYLVTVKVEMETRAQPSQVRTNNRRAGTNPFLSPGNFVLPGVPQKKEFVETQDNTGDTAVNSLSAEAQVRKILITILVAPDITRDQVRAVRDFITASIPFNPLRGDEMDIQNSPLLKRVTPEASPARPSAVSPAGDRNALPGARSTGFFGSIAEKAAANGPLLLLVAAVAILLTILLLFLFGPVRAFLNRLLAVLPRVGEQAAYAVTNAPQKTAVGGLGATGPTGMMNGGRSAHDPNGTDSPFHFIREDQLNKLPILFRQMAAPQVALVLAYLPPEWASRVLGELTPADQTAIMAELTQAREVPPEIVKDIEEQVKSKLPYLVGGVDWIQSVYQFTQPQTQRALLGTLNQQAPELAEQLRRHTFFFEDLGVLNAGALRLVAQEIGYPLLASALKDERPEMRDAVLRRLPPAVREIVQQELDLSSEDRTASADAKMRLVTLARRLIQEGRLTLPERK